MNLTHLYYFRTLAEVKHYTRAARELYIAQPTLSAAISQLERELGAQLFIKSPHQVQLTACGEDFYDYVCSAIVTLEKGISVVRERMGGTCGKITLGTTFAMQGKHWSQAVQSFRAQLDSNVRIDIKQGFTYQLVDELKKGELDVVFGGKIRDDPALRFMPCWSQELVLVANKEHPLAARPSVSIDDLKAYRMVGYVAGTNPAGEEMRRLVEEEGLDIDQSYNDEITMCSLASSDPSCLALLCYSFLVRSFDDVAAIPLDDVPKDFHQVYLIYRNDRTRLKVVDQFIEFVSSYTFPILSPGDE